MLLVGFHAIQGRARRAADDPEPRAFGFYGRCWCSPVHRARLRLPRAQLVIQADAMNLLPLGHRAEWIAILTVPVIVLTIYGYDWIHAGSGG